jgi:hypothetical protein
MPNKLLIREGKPKSRVQTRGNRFSRNSLRLKIERQRASRAASELLRKIKRLNRKYSSFGKVEPLRPLDADAHKALASAILAVRLNNSQNTSGYRGMRRRNVYGAMDDALDADVE